MPDNPERLDTSPSDIFRSDEVLIPSDLDAAGPSRNDDEPIWAEVADEPPIVPRGLEPRVWPVFVIIPLSIFASAIAGGVVSALAVILRDGRLPASSEAFSERVGEVFASPAGPYLLLVGSLVFLSAALLGASLSPLSIQKRLGLLPLGTGPLRTLLLILFTPVIGWLTSGLLEKVTSAESENMLFLFRIVQSADSPFRMLLLVFVLGVMPGLSEELLFRGYLQRRLLEVWSAPAAIGVTSLLFAAAHLEPLHVLGVLPLGLWLGFIAWRCQSTWPAIVAHTLNNSLAVVMMLVFGEQMLQEHHELDPVDAPVVVSVEEASLTSSPLDSSRLNSTPLNSTAQLLGEPYDARIGITAGQLNHLGQNLGVIQTRK